MPLKNLFRKAVTHPDVAFWAEYTAATGAATALVTGGAGLMYGASLPQVFLGAVGVGLIPGAIMGAGMLAPAPVQSNAGDIKQDVFPSKPQPPGSFGPDPWY